MPEERDETLSNIDVLWLKAIYDDLRNFGEHIILAKTGFKGIEDVISLQQGDIVEIQLRNLKLSTIKFLSILDNVQTKVSDKFFKDTRKQLKIIEKTIGFEEAGNKKFKPIHFKWNHNDIKHERWKELTDKFYASLNLIDDKKSDLIKELDSLLYFSQEGSNLDKTKQKKRIR